MNIYTEEYINTLYNHRTKTRLLSSIINLYCKTTYIDRNLWMLQYISETLQKIEDNSRKHQEVKTIIWELVQKICSLQEKKFAVPSCSIDHLLYSTVPIHENVNSISHFLTEDAIVLLNVLHMNIEMHAEPEQSLQIVSHMIETPCTVTKEIDAYDCLFIFALKVAEELDPKIRNYVFCCKDIFYYMLKQKDKGERKNLLYYAIFVLVTKRVHYKSREEPHYFDIVPQISRRRTPELTQASVSQTKNITVVDSRATSRKHFIKLDK